MKGEQQVEGRMLHPLSEFASEFARDERDEGSSDAPSYWYEGRCPQSGVMLRLPRTPFVEAIARSLMAQLGGGDRLPDGKMFGVLLVELPSGEQGVLKAFSGSWQGRQPIEGWVPAIPGREEVAGEEAQTLEALEAMKAELMALQHHPERSRHTALKQHYDDRLRALSECHRHRKHQRQHQRQACALLPPDQRRVRLEQLDDESRRDGLERRHLKQERDRVLVPLEGTIAAISDRMHLLKQQRKALSQQLQRQMYTAYRLTNFAGLSRSLEDVVLGAGIPTGTGDCCAPKLLHAAAVLGCRPLAMAEFWWGQPSADGRKHAGQFYGACEERCQPLMGFLLSGLTPTSSTLPILYEDEWILAVHKPAGLLSVPGRYRDRQDSVLSRLTSNEAPLLPVHRLDQDTSGILLLAKERLTQRHLSQQFHQHRVHKVYEAVLNGMLQPDAGTIALPLGPNPGDRPRQRVDWQQGKPSTTHFRVIARTEAQTRVELIPITGRTHQIRVHAAAPEGLGMAILGDRLYGCPDAAQRLHLHARELHIHHPHTHTPLHLITQTPF